jgi:hypothetical protein
MEDTKSLTRGFGGSGWIRTNGSGVSGKGETRSGDYKSPALNQLSHAASVKEPMRFEGIGKNWWA